MPADQMESLLGILADMLLPQNLVETLSDIDDEKVRRYYEQLSQVYADGFRHRYSDISAFLGNNSPDVYSSLDNWLTAVSSYAEENDQDGETAPKIIKLLDHIRLEMIRIDRMKAVAQYASQSSLINEQIHAIAQETSDMATVAEEKVKRFHEQSIAILSIFSAVILAFMGGISFSSGVLGSIAQASMFRLIVTILLLGFVLFNSIFILMRFIAYMLYKKDSNRFKNGIKWFNGALLTIFLVLVVAYASGAGEYIERWGQLTAQATSGSQVATEM
ncbi:hypothetical protein [Candidatus Allofournierella merdipullorum]|uniref:hypothetical protein n=1 Tax=Candidatus Allofournierella merdipullorum TaxID=2838595 RepID=UPI00374E5A81